MLGRSHSRLKLAGMALGAGLIAAAACTDQEPLAPAASPSNASIRQADGAACHPTARNRPVCPRGAPAGVATFVDPTAMITGAGHVSLGAHVYVGPFARLLAGDAGIAIGGESNVQDNVTIHADIRRDDATRRHIRALGLLHEDGVEIAERVIVAHGTTIKGPAKVGIGGGKPDEQSVLLSFGTEKVQMALSSNATRASRHWGVSGQACVSAAVS